jgi:type IX secretion system PorP/SprF family membrane protein
MKKYLITICSMVSIYQSQAQAIHFMPFETTPMVINPALTGMFDGRIRACGFYSAQWNAVEIPFVTCNASVDLPLVTFKNGDYLAAGVQLYNDKAGDGNLTNFMGLGSLAYHKVFGKTDTASGRHRFELAAGIQAGYAQASINLSYLYFGNSLIPSAPPYYPLSLGHVVQYYPIDAGISFCHAPCSRLNYIIGFSANNINQPNDALARKQYLVSGLDLNFTGVIGANLLVARRLTIQPAILCQAVSDDTRWIGGSDIQYGIGKSPKLNTAVFAGLWLRSGKILCLVPGIQFKGFRIGLGYDYYLSNPGDGKGAVTVALKYILSQTLQGRTVTCNRF